MVSKLQCTHDYENGHAEIDVDVTLVASAPKCTTIQSFAQVLQGKKHGVVLGELPRRWCGSPHLVDEHMHQLLAVFTSMHGLLNYVIVFVYVNGFEIADVNNGDLQGN